MSEGPKRTSTEPTLVMDRSRLLPAPELREQLPDLIVTDPHDDEDEAVPQTEVACPTCQRCQDCRGTHTVSIEARSRLLRKETGLP